MIIIGKKIISKKSKTFIIAEAGVNHNGKINIAKKLAEKAKESGADAVKFQNFIAKNLIRKNAPKAEYQNRNIGKKKTQFEMLKELELDEKKTIEVSKHCKKIGIAFLSTAYDFRSLEILEKINIEAHKLASIDIVTHPLIKKIAKTKKPLILSTGMSNEKEIKEAVDVFCKYSNKKLLALLQCNTNYPSPPEDQNLLSLNILKKYVEIIGFSDHTNGDEASIISVALGGKIIERHFTLDKKMKGPDHKASQDPKEFYNFVKSIRKSELIIGEEVKKPFGGEIENLISMRRSICAKTDINRDEKIKEWMLDYKRPGNGLAPTDYNINKIINKKAKKNIPKDDNIEFNFLY